MSETGSQANEKLMWITAVVVLTCAGAFQTGWGILARDSSATHVDAIAALLSEPNQIQFESYVVETVLKLIEDPNAFTDSYTLSEPDPAQTPSRESEKPHRYWQRRYHRQVNGQLFAYLKYPYGDSGIGYGQSESRGIAAVEANSFGPMREGIVAMTDLIHRWRDMNESEGTMLEVVRAIELTKATTQIITIRSTFRTIVSW